MKYKVILASASPRRKKLLSPIIEGLEIHPSQIEEPEPLSGESAEAYTAKLAALKAHDVLKKRSGDEEGIIIGADTTVSLDNKLLNKPVDADDAFKMLRSLSGRTHIVCSGVYVVHFSKEEFYDIDEPFSIKPPSEIYTLLPPSVSFTVLTKVTFSRLSDYEINAYIKTGSPFDKAGAYGIQDDLGALFVKKIDGDYNNVVGFPLSMFYQRMKDFAPRLLRF
ncbi:MAG: Maf family protein [Balneolales bacterium]|nr:Maf family protein [Balneolales bacterium]